MSNQISAVASKAIRGLKNKLAMMKRIREMRQSKKSDGTVEEKKQIKNKLASLARKMKHQGN